MSIASPVPPNLRSLLDAFKEEVFADLNCHEIGVIQSFDYNHQTAVVQINTLRMVNGKPLSYPLLTDVPVFVLGGGTAFVNMPITAGDECVVLFNDQDLDNWFTTGNLAAPNTPRSHSLSDGIALVGVKSKASARGDYLNGQLGLVWAGNKITIQPFGGGTYRVTVYNANGSEFTLKEDGTFILKDVNNVGVSSTPEGKLSIHADLASLNNVLTQLIGALDGWVNTGGSTPNAATLTSLSYVQTLIDNLLV